jgi:RPA family protein
VVFQISCGSSLVKREDKEVVHNERNEMKMSRYILPKGSKIARIRIIGTDEELINDMQN